MKSKLDFKKKVLAGSLKNSAAILCDGDISVWGDYKTGVLNDIKEESRVAFGFKHIQIKPCK
jgi:hypothetical protein